MHLGDDLLMHASPSLLLCLLPLSHLLPFLQDDFDIVDSFRQRVDSSTDLTGIVDLFEMAASYSRQVLEALPSEGSRCCFFGSDAVENPATAPSCLLNRKVFSTSICHGRV